MSEGREMEEMLACAPAGRDEALVPVLCVEATASTQETLERAVRTVAAAAANGDRHACTSSAAALQELKKLPGTCLRVSPYATVHMLRGFLAAQEAEASSSVGGWWRRVKAEPVDSLANAQFFAVRVPAAAAATASEVCVAEGHTGEEEEETLVALPLHTTLCEVVSGGGVLLLSAESPAAAAAAVSTPAATLLLLYTRESQFGDMDGGDFLCIGLCAALIACCVAMCVSQAASAAKEKKQQQQYEQQQQQQAQYYQNQQQQGAYQNYEYNQPYYSGQPGATNSYGAPPQQPVNGYPVAQPAYYNYSGNPTYSQPPVVPPAQYYNNPNNQYQQGNQEGNYPNYPGKVNPNNGYPTTAPL